MTHLIGRILQLKQHCLALRYRIGEAILHLLHLRLEQFLLHLICFVEVVSWVHPLHCLLKLRDLRVQDLDRGDRA